MPAHISFDMKKFILGQTQRDETTGCLVWRGRCDPNGYGRITIKRRSRLVHRVLWAKLHGPIPPGVVIRHSCDNPPCIEDTHLIAGTQLENIEDARAKGRMRGKSRPGEANPQSKLTKSQVHAILLDPRSATKVAADYGVSNTLVKMIRSGKAWSKAL